MDSDDRDAPEPPHDESSGALPTRSFSDLVDAVEERRGDATDEGHDDPEPSAGGGGDAEPAGGESAAVQRDGPEPGESGGSTDFSGLTEAVERRRGLSEWEWVRFGSDAGRWATDVTMDPKTDALLEVLGDAANVLLSGPLVCPSEYEACTRLLGTAGPERQNALIVTFTESPDDRIDVCRGYLDEQPEQTVVLSVGDRVRSGTGAAAVNVTAGGPVRIEALPDPSDLVQLGMTISRYLSDWEAAEARSVVCFHSLTALLRFADDLREVFRFLHVLQSHVRETGARAHYHVEADAHDEETIATLRPLFDVVLTYDVDEPVSVEW